MNIRTTLIDGEPWFVAKDVCAALGLNLTQGATQHLVKLNHTERSTLPAGTFGPDLGTRGRGGLRANTPLAVVAESGLYKLILRSDKAEAVVFQNWVTQEVLPSIRKTGKYALADHGRESMPLPMDIAEAVALATAEALRDALSPITQALAAILARSLPEPERFFRAYAVKRLYALPATSAAIGAALTFL
ncbi:Bro-N domain-containing protein [Brevundimonas sp. NPDC090276]|uniref:BRO-N domain-containing protein n=1 Tax=Brevundimonas sp. NPDC090276 TaxID=3363956 RepID=UPI00383A87AA